MPVILHLEFKKFVHNEKKILFFELLICRNSKCIELVFFIIKYQVNVWFFRWKIWRWKETLMWNEQHFQHFFTKSNAAEYTSLKTLHSILNFSNFYKIICKWIIKKVKINLDIIFWEKTFDYGEVKRWVIYLLKILKVCHPQAW